MNHSQVIQQSLHTLFASAKLIGEIKDGVLAIRVIGEFSAGKTRLLQELLRDITPAALLPISSPERQTLLPLEITYGEIASLSLIKREQDTEDGEVLKTLSHFPDRPHLEAQNMDLTNTRLRLSVPETRFILPNGDGYVEGNEPKRLFLVDMPGWNSGEHSIEEEVCGAYNLSLIYVANYMRLDSKFNQTKLIEVLEQFKDGFFQEKHRLVYIVTHCPAKDSARIRASETARFQALLSDLDFSMEDVELCIHCVDFDDFKQNAALRTRFSQDFWHDVLGEALCNTAPLKPSIVNEINQWKPEWQLNSLLKKSFALMQTAEELFSNLQKDKQYIFGMNSTRLMGLSAKECTDRLLASWKKQLGLTLNTQFAPQLLEAKDCPANHPLSDWFVAYWMVKTNHILSLVYDFYQLVEKTIRMIPHDGNIDIQAYLAEKLDKKHQVMAQEMLSAFVLLCQHAQKLCAAGVLISPAKQVATLMALSAIEAKYSDHGNTDSRYSAPAIEWRCKRKNGTFHHSVTAQQKIACKVDSVIKDLELVHLKLENSDYVVGVGFAEMRQLGLDPFRLQQHYQLHAVVQEVDNYNASLLFHFHAIA